MTALFRPDCELSTTSHGSFILIGSQAFPPTVGVCAEGAALKFKFEQSLFCAVEKRGSEKRSREPLSSPHYALFVYTYWCTRLKRGCLSTEYRLLREDTDKNGSVYRGESMS